MPKLSLILALLSSSTVLAAGPDSAVERIMKDVRALSDDSMEGRGAGTPGEARAGKYLIERFTELGLEKVKGSYQQPVKLVGVKKDAKGSSLSFSAGKEPFDVPSGKVSYWSTSLDHDLQVNDIPMIFVGYGVEAPEYDWDDFKGLDVKGKVLLFLNDDPQVTEKGKALFKGEARTYYGRWTYKFEEAVRRGAAGAFIIHTDETAGYPFSVVQHHGVSEAIRLDREGAGYPLGLLGWFDEETSERVAKKMGTTLDGLLEKARSRDFRPMEVGLTVRAKLRKAVRRFQSTNYWAALRAKKGPRSNEWIVVTAHLDHLGLVPEPKDGDKVFNGAWDNASGVASMLELARQLSSGRKLGRSVLFLATTAEEKGTLGSNWFVSNPPVPARNLVANFNFDMVQIFGVTSDVAAIGLETSSLGKTLRAVAKQRRVTVTGDKSPREGSFYRSDQVHFAKAGIPALFLTPGEKYLEKPPVDLEEYGEAHYHQPADEVEDSWDLSGAVRDLEIVRDVLERVANAKDVPRWVKGNEFEKAFSQRRGKGK